MRLFSKQGMEVFGVILVVLILPVIAYAISSHWLPSAWAAGITLVVAIVAAAVIAGLFITFGVIMLLSVFFDAMNNR